MPRAVLRCGGTSPSSSSSRIWQCLPNMAAPPEYGSVSLIWQCLPNMAAPPEYGSASLMSHLALVQQLAHALALGRTHLGGVELAVGLALRLAEAGRVKVDRAVRLVAVAVAHNRLNVCDDLRHVCARARRR
eukprot:3597011-Prymnesium_polylepis.1